MPLHLHIDGLARIDIRRRAPLAASCLLHGTAFFILMHAPAIQLAEPSKSAYQQAIEGHETKLVWYKFDKELPAVRPPDVKAERKPLRAEIKAPQEMVASRKEAPKRTQIIWTAAPELRETPPVALPNIVAIKLPEVTRPFVAPQAVKPSEAPKIAVPADAPLLQAKLDAFKLADAPKVTKPFVPPPTTVPQKLAQVVAPSDAPQVEARALPPVLNESFKAPARPFTAPPVKAAAQGTKPPSLEAPPDLIANSHDLSVVVAGLNPTITPMALPANSNPAQFSAGPKVRPEGADSAGDGKGFTVPGLYVAGAKDAKPDLLAQAFAAPTSPATLRAAARLGNPRIAALPAEAASSPSGAVRVSAAPDKRFDGRDVYMMAIQMPNLTSWSGSWLMWYADRTAREAGLAPIAPPVAHRKVDPKYVASAQSDKIEGKIQLACVIGKDGRVSHVEMVRGLDDRLNQTAQEAISKWEFTPATREGVPVEVDVLVEIPFRLEHRVPVSY